MPDLGTGPRPRLVEQAGKRSRDSNSRQGKQSPVTTPGCSPSMSPSLPTGPVAWPQGHINSSPIIRTGEPRSHGTPASLLTRVKDSANRDAWEEFVQQYSPVVYGFARTRGLQDADAADITQDVLWSVSRHIHKMEYDPARGTFRGWLYTVTRNKIYNFLAVRRKRLLGSGGGMNQKRLDAVPDESAHPEPEWELEYWRMLSARAMQLVKNSFLHLAGTRVVALIAFGFDLHGGQLATAECVLADLLSQVLTQRAARNERCRAAFVGCRWRSGRG